MMFRRSCLAVIGGEFLTETSRRTTEKMLLFLHLCLGSKSTIINLLTDRRSHSCLEAEIWNFMSMTMEMVLPFLKKALKK